MFILAISRRHKLPETDNTVAYEISTATCSNAEIEQITDFVKKALIALDYQNGPAHVEVMRSITGELFIVDAGARGGGFMVADGIVLVASGFDLPTATVLSSIGVDFQFKPPSIDRAYVLRFISSQSGIIKSYFGFEEANQHPNVLATPLVDIGSRCSNASCDADRVCYILTHGKSYKEATQYADKAEKYLNFIYEPEPIAYE